MNKRQIEALKAQAESEEPLPINETDKAILEKLKRERNNYLKPNARDDGTAKH